MIELREYERQGMGNLLRNKKTSKEQDLRIEDMDGIEEPIANFDLNIRKQRDKHVLPQQAEVLLRGKNQNPTNTNLNKS